MSEEFLNRCLRDNSNIASQNLDFDQSPVTGLNFKGFSESDQIYSEKIRQTCWIKPFRGFTPNDLRHTSQACKKSERLLQRTRRAVSPTPFLGFDIEEKKSSSTSFSTVSDFCQKLEDGLYKRINRKLLRKYNVDEKMVRSKYWAQTKMEDVFPAQYKIKVEDKADADTMDREHAIISQIHQLNKELSELRKIKQAAEEQAKLQTSPFFQVKKELSLPKFVPPKSPHHLLEEELYLDPWSLLIGAIFVNKTTARAAKPYVFWFLEDNPDPFTVLTRRVEDLELYFGSLGLKKTKAKQVWKMSHDFLYKDWTKVGDLYGVGKYAEDAFRMFCLGDFSVEPEDRYLRIYKSWYVNQEKKARLTEMNS